MIDLALSNGQVFVWNAEGKLFNIICIYLFDYYIFIVLFIKFIC